MNVVYKYNVKKAFLIVYWTLIGFCLLLTIGRWLSVFISDFVIINAEIHYRVSNLSLSMLFYLGIGYIWILSGVKFRTVTLLGIFSIAANFVCETMMGFMNTADIMDAIYGTVGIIVVFIYLFSLHKYGLIPIENES